MLTVECQGHPDIPDRVTLTSVKLVVCELFLSECFVVFPFLVVIRELYKLKYFPNPLKPKTV